jgi:hypothetical protein
VSIYTPQMREAVHRLRPPHGISIAIVDYDTFLGVQFYESQMAHLSEKQRLDCHQYFNLVKTIIASFGVNTTLDPILDLKYNDTRRI